MSKEIRTPIQQRSIETKKRIIESGYKLFAQNGYFNTNTAQIAKEAGVSTGIVYGYFHDKRDILLDVLDIYVSIVFTPAMEAISRFEKGFNLNILSNIVDNTVVIHKKNASIHEALHTLSFTDNAVNEKFLMLEDEMTNNIVTALKNGGYEKPNVYERVHLAIETVQSYAHECVYDKHSYINYENMRTLVIFMLTKLFEKD